MSTTPGSTTTQPRNIVEDRLAADAPRVEDLDEETVAYWRGRKGAPKKWFDRERNLLTAEYQAWQQTHPPFDVEKAGEATLQMIGNGAANHAMYYPEKYGKDLGDGSWVIITQAPRQHGIPEVPKMSMWWARPHVLTDGYAGRRAPYQALVMTVDGPLHLWPHEYIAVPDPETFVGRPGTEVHSLGGEAAVDPEHLFALMSRGIDRQQATLMLFHQINTPGVAYVTFADDVVAFFDRPGITSERNSTGKWRSGVTITHNGKRLIPPDAGWL